MGITYAINVMSVSVCVCVGGGGMSMWVCVGVTRLA